MANTGKPTIWIIEESSTLHEDRIKILRSCGYDVYVANGISSFDEIVSKVRPTTILVDTFKESSKTVKLLQHISSQAELATCRSCLIELGQDSEVKRTALAANFRDFIPWQLANQEWVHRVQYATASKPMEAPSTLCGMYINQPAIIAVPARIVWINETHMRIECRGHQKIGNTLQITGPIAKEWGVSHISLTVESVHKNKLLYRFSQAIVARWSVPTANMKDAITSINSLNDLDTSIKVRVFLALSRPDWRKLAIDSITQDRHELNVAMTRSHISSEFKFFSPDVVFFDDKVLSSFTDDELLALFAKVPSDIPLVVFGNGFDEPKVRSLLLGRPLFVEVKPTSAIFSNAITRYKLSQHLHDTIVASQVSQIPSTHEWSYAELEITSRLLQINPKNGVLSLPFSIGPFALARLDSPLFKKSLQRNVYIKITQLAESEFSDRNPKFTHNAEFMLSDVSSEECKKLSHTLLATISDYYQKTFGSQRKLVPLGQHVPEQAPIPAVTQPLPPQSEPDAPITYSENISTEPQILDEKKEIKPQKFRSNIIIRKSDATRKPTKPKIDPVIVKALGVFALAILVMILIIYAATHVDESSYKDHGKEYSEFFKRMKDPDYRKTNPAQPENSQQVP